MRFILHDLISAIVERMVNFNGPLCGSIGEMCFLDELIKEFHVFDPKNFVVLEREDRNLWQNPEELLGNGELQPHFVVADVLTDPSLCCDPADVPVSYEIPICCDMRGLLSFQFLWLLSKEPM